MTFQVLAPHVKLLQEVEPSLNDSQARETLTYVICGRIPFHSTIKVVEECLHGLSKEDRNYIMQVGIFDVLTEILRTLKGIN